MYPKMVFKTPGDQVLPGGKSYGFKVVHSDEEMAAAFTVGWFPTVPEAVVPPTREEPTREELEAKAAELGIRFSKKATDEQLGEAIAAKLAE